MKQQEEIDKKPKQENSKTNGQTKKERVNQSRAINL